MVPNRSYASLAGEQPFEPQPKASKQTTDGAKCCGLFLILPNFESMLEGRRAFEASWLKLQRMNLSCRSSRTR